MVVAETRTLVGEKIRKKGDILIMEIEGRPIGLPFRVNIECLEVSHATAKILAWVTTQ